MKQAASREYVVRRARELAAAGGHVNYLSIETELWNEGHFQARIWLDDIVLRGELKLLCAHARLRSSGFAGAGGGDSAGTLNNAA
jgi:hypothetical protein